MCAGSSKRIARSRGSAFPTSNIGKRSSPGIAWQRIAGPMRSVSGKVIASGVSSRALKRSDAKFAPS